MHLYSRERLFRQHSWQINLFCLLLAGVGSSKVNAADLVISAELGQLQYQMIETGATGNLLNQEDGTLPTERLSLRWEQPMRSIDLSLWQGKNRIVYSGYTQIGFPLATQTDLQAQGWQLRFEQSWPLLQSSTLGMSVGLDSIKIDRLILPALFASPLREILDSTRLLLGAEVKTEFTTPMNWPLHISVRTDLLKPFKQQLSVDSFGLYDLVSLSPWKNTDRRVSLKLSLAPLPSVRLWWNLTREDFTPGSTPFQTWNKNGVPATMVRYPGSQQSMQSVSLGASWQF